MDGWMDNGRMDKEGCENLSERHLSTEVEARSSEFLRGDC